MPSQTKRLLAVLVIAGSASFSTLGCGGKNTEQPTPAVDSVARAAIERINKYLGTMGTGSPDSTLLDNIRKNNLFLQNALADMQCDIYKLQHPNEECPGPSTSPTVPPKYPQ